jgi:hypothetical protein
MNTDDKELFEATVKHAAYMLSLADILATAARMQYEVYGGAYPGLVAALKQYEAERD